ncbi:hypothetical protein Sjap_021329 [Stephania japonica]|uniref:Leucine-rich repeat-containing N-terminal plant-type domain-containing protein n=1 Tax=Stephania japonica TaxID=461633 RepID=A0AAP0HSR7_9MAGN
MAFPVVFPLPHNHCSWFCFFFLLLVSFLQLAYSISLANNSSSAYRNPISSCRPDQSIALLQFKSSFSIESVSKLRSWKANTDCCSSWDGVSCDDFGYVIGLDVSESWLVGNIDSNSSLFNLYHLQNVNLAFNDFNSSSIPAGFVRMNRSLTHLNLSWSRLSGEVPQEIAQLTNLISLDLSRLDLVVKTPNTLLRTLMISNFSSLMELHLDGFMGDGYSSMESAQEWLSEITSAGLHHLQVLTLRDCNLAGSIGTSLLNSSSLSHLDLSNNDITHFPQQMFHLPNLKVLKLSGNSHLTGSLPDEFPPWTTLQQLFLTWTSFSGRIPHSIGNLKQLTHFQVGSCGFSGPLPHSLGSLEQLAFLDLGGNNFEGEIPCSFSKLSRLKDVDMSSNRFVGPLPSLNSSRKTIELIDLSSNKFSDLSSNKFSGPIPSSYYANNGLPSLIELTLSNNQLNGSIPPSLFSLPCLQEMYLDQNKFIGILEDEEEFPYSFSSPLETLYLSHNLLEGNFRISSLNLQA